MTNNKQGERCRRVLIVEDEFLVASQAEECLKESGFDVVGVAASADEALRFAHEQRPAIVVMDIRLKGARDGIDAALEIFESFGIRCLFATAHSDPNMKLRAQPARPLGWLPKPYTADTLVSLISQAIVEQCSDQNGVAPRCTK